jgi:hypothetical protein
VSRLGALAAIGLLWLASPASAQESYLLIVAGLGGEPKYSDAFHAWAGSLQAAAEKRAGLPRDHILYLGEKPERAPREIDGRSTREDVVQALQRIAARARPGDTVAIVLFGHGSALSGEARFNLPGPDLTATDFVRLLQPFALQRLVFVNASSASGDFVKALAGKNRVIVTATKSGLERNESVFGEHFAEAFSGESADVDKSGRVSVLEAFEYARQKVAQSYQTGNRLQTEHAQLEDGAEGALARSTFLAAEARAAEAGSSDPKLIALETERRALEDRIEALKAQKHALAGEVYEKELEGLLLELALKNEAIRAAKGAK